MTIQCFTEANVRDLNRIVKMLKFWLTSNRFMSFLRAFLQNKRDHFLLVGLVLLAWWPISTFQFVPKWDNIDCYLPYRYFVSWSEVHGHLPLWNPFQHMGYPAYSDMQNGMYNPFVQLLMLCGDYSPTSLMIELLSYTVLAALGAYQLSGLFVSGRIPRFVIGISYGLSGFMLGTSQIMIFLAGAAFLPWILYHFWLLLRNGHRRNLLLAGIFTALEVTVASPAYTIVLVYLLFGLTVINLWMYRKVEVQRLLKRWAWQLPLLGALLILLLLPYVISVLDFLPYFGRADQLEYGPYLLQNPFDFHSWFSFVYPYPTLANSKWFEATDMTMRSAYFGWLPFLFCLFSLRFLKEKKVVFLWLGVAIFTLIAAGGSTPVYRLIYEIPGFGLFRHPSLFRAHLILCMALLAGIGMERWMQGQKQGLFKWILISFLGLTILIFAWSSLHPFTNDLKELFSWHEPTSDWKPHFMKSYFLLNTVVVLLLGLIGLWVLWKGRSAKWFVIITVFDLLIYSQVTLPATVYSPYERTDYEAYFNVLPDQPDQQSAIKPYKELVENYEPKMMGIWRNTATYHKSLTFDGHNQTQFKGFNVVEQNGGLEFAKENPLFYEISERIDLKKDTLRRANCLWQVDDKLLINKDTLQISDPVIGYNQFSVKADNPSKRSDLLILNQNFHKGWSAKLNGKPLKIHRANDAFMAVEIPATSKGMVIFNFDAPVWRMSLWIGAFSWMLCVIFIFWKRRTNTN